MYLHYVFGLAGRMTRASYSYRFNSKYLDTYIIFSNRLDSNFVQFQKMKYLRLNEHSFNTCMVILKKRIYRSLSYTYQIGLEFNYVFGLVGKMTARIRIA